MIAMRQCPHGYDHPTLDQDMGYPHSCDGCWCDDRRDRLHYGWAVPVEQPAER